MPDPQSTADDEDDGGPPNRDRWTTNADGIEQAGVVIEIEDLTTPEQKARNAEHARIKAESLELAHRLAAQGGDDDDDDADEQAGDARKD